MELKSSRNGIKKIFKGSNITDEELDLLSIKYVNNQKECNNEYDDTFGKLIVQLAGKYKIDLIKVLTKLIKKSEIKTNLN